ncbi:MAG TPA: LemA family protein [Candidatus Absconditabacterales bacterium]|nr:LemA family protein [Candidatus Absconditabacterales bacterium]HMT27263.1 LemA family protein [Candidatus Absconditabacterales bacterium]
MFIGILIVVAVVILFLISIYNRLVGLKHNVENAFADIDVQMKMRFDLIENLVNTVKGYASHEKDTLEKLTSARTSFMSAQSTNDKIEADSMLTGALKSLFAVSENYPDLKANQNFLQLQTELADIENKIAAVRRFFNSAIKEYNVALEVFPNNILAGMYGFQKERGYFEVTDEAEKKVPQVHF